MRMNRGLMGLGVALGSLAFLAAPAMADLNINDTQLNPSEGLPGLGPFYTDGLPAWYTAPALVVSMTANITGGSIPFKGTVLSEVYYVNGVDETGGLGFVYRVTLNPDAPGVEGDNLVRASFATADWYKFTIFDAGSDNSGTSAVLVNSNPWSDGDPYSIERKSDGAPALNWRSSDTPPGDVGTLIKKGQTSALVWFETDAPKYSISTVSLLDSGATGEAAIYVPYIPSPTAAVLGLIGTALVGLRRRKVQA